MTTPIAQVHGPGVPLRPGDRVAHPQKGRATVISVDHDTVTARFDDGATRQFVVWHVGLRRLVASDEGRISPSWAQLQDPTFFLPPLTFGEERLARFLDRLLPEDWRIYVRPHLDADRPLLAALHPTRGGMVWDVVDWDLSEFSVEGGLWMRAAPGGGRFASPFAFLNQVRSRIYGVYVPEIGEAVNDEERRFRVVRAGVFFPHAATDRARELAQSDPAARHIDAFGPDALDDQSLNRVIPIIDRGRELEPGWFEALDTAFSRDYRYPDPLSTITLNAEQRPLATPRDGYIEIEGVAGSGKSIVLAHRAARRAASGGRVLILTYNRTLTNYVRAMIRLAPVPHRPDAITVLHFHELCRRVHDHWREPLPAIPQSEDPAGAESGEALEVDWPTSAMRLIGAHGVPPALRFDAVYVDEAQDFGASWFRLVSKLCPSEVVVAYDSAQRLYERQEVMSRGEVARLFGGRSARARKLAVAERLSGPVAELAAAFAARWSLPTQRLEPAGETERLFEGRCQVHDCSCEREAAAAALAVLDDWRSEPGYRARDVAVIVPSKSFGAAFVRLLAERGVSTNHVFAVRSSGALLELPLPGVDAPPWRVAQAHKTAFAFGDSRLKVSTTHSFKGWEAFRVIAVLPFHAPPGRVDIAQAYVALTRSKGDLVVLGRIADYGLAEMCAPEPLLGLAEVAERFATLESEAQSATLPRGAPLLRQVAGAPEAG